MEWMGFRFAEPWWLLSALAGPLMALIAWSRERWAPAVVFPGSASLDVAMRGWRVRWRHLPLAASALGLVLGGVALARPQSGVSRQKMSTRGVDIVVALDVSGSMAAEDFQPRNRLAVAKDVVSEFVRRRTSDRVGLVVFAARSLTKVPPTVDQSVLLRQLDDVRLNMLPDGTAIGSALATSLTRLRRSQSASRIIVLVTDGGNNAGEIDPATATDIARAMGVRVYTIGVGSAGPVPIVVRVQDPNTGEIVGAQKVMVEVKFDEELLKRIATQTGGAYFPATDPAALRGVFERIERLEKSDIKLTALRRYRELYTPWLLASAVSFALSGLLWAAGLRVAPVL
jgi:Ca-activated chloride channel family protein